MNKLFVIFVFEKSLIFSIVLQVHETNGRWSLSMQHAFCI